MFINLKKDFGRVTRHEQWYRLRKSGVTLTVAGRYVHDVYKYRVATIKCTVGVTEGFEVKVGLYQGSFLSTLLFAMMIERLTDGIRPHAHGQ